MLIQFIRTLYTSVLVVRAVGGIYVRVHHSRIDFQGAGMGVQPALRVKRKRSLAPLEPAPRPPAAAAFVTPGAVQQGGSNGVVGGSNNSNWTERGPTRSSAAASNDQGGGIRWKDGRRIRLALQLPMPFRLLSPGMPRRVARSGRDERMTSSVVCLE